MPGFQAISDDLDTLNSESKFVLTVQGESQKGQRGVTLVIGLGRDHVKMNF